MSIQKVPVEKIRIKDRIREDLGDLEPLKESIKKNGLFHPIQIDSNYNLISGHRRLQAVKELGMPRIEARVIEMKNRLDRFEVELQENILRKDLTDDELSRSIEIKNGLMRRSIFRIIFDFLKRVFSFLISLFRGKR